MYDKGISYMNHTSEKSITEEKDFARAKETGKIRTSSLYWMTSDFSRWIQIHGLHYSDT